MNFFFESRIYSPLFHSRMDCHIWSSDTDHLVRHQGPGGSDAQDRMVHSPLLCRTLCYDEGKVSGVYVLRRICPQL